MFEKTIITFTKFASLDKNLHYSITRLHCIMINSFKELWTGPLYYQDPAPGSDRVDIFKCDDLSGNSNCWLEFHVIQKMESHCTWIGCNFAILDYWSSLLKCFKWFELIGNTNNIEYNLYVSRPEKIWSVSGNLTFFLLIMRYKSMQNLKYSDGLEGISLYFKSSLRRSFIWRCPWLYLA